MSSTIVFPERTQPPDCGIREPKNLRQQEVVSAVIDVLQGEEGAEYEGFDAVAYAEYAHDHIISRDEDLVALYTAVMAPESVTAQLVRSRIAKKWHSMAEDL